MKRAASRPLTAPARMIPAAGERSTGESCFKVFVRVRPENEMEKTGAFRKVGEFFFR